MKASEMALWLWAGGRPKTRLSAKSFDKLERCCTGCQSCKNLNDKEVTFSKYIREHSNKDVLGDFLTTTPTICILFVSKNDQFLNPPTQSNAYAICECSLKYVYGKMGKNLISYKIFGFSHFLVI